MAKWDPQDDDHMIGTINFPHLFSYLDPRVGRQETTESFNFLAWHSLDPCVWAVRADDDRFDDLAGLLSYIEENPGEITFSSTAVGSDDHMGIAYAEKFLPNFEVRKLYANGDSKKLQEVIGGVSDVVAGNVGYFTSYVDNGQLKFLTVLHDEPYPKAPGVPTFKEVTGKPNISFAGRTMCVANGLPDDKKAAYLEAVQRAITNVAYVAQEETDNNNLLFLQGEAMRDKIAETRDYVVSVEFWNAES
jgi:tripartite-type tricarboxylate transporter receptor subunit TctC